ncbi:DUF397 domain-containing protein [Micromonospora wenchangensis]|uniref:DUF397 domain-containing protein n=1 Tax=Micromonospora wenchangensis TaxID=1185415 RepID=A0A246RE54_9ACTN|nr:DUF397 domain-containing protein [Micromonospora wenchangensis]OWU99812.1 DUF397 domain-containing protein [Micromonospora wenchangensis]
MPDLSSAVWRKSIHSNNGGNCVEVADDIPGVVGIRDSKDPSGPALTFAPRAWTRFLTSVKQQPPQG